MSEQAGVIHANVLYTLEAFKRQLDISDAMLRSARRNGLKVHRAHGRGFVLGSEWIGYVTGNRVTPRLSSHSGT